MIYLGADHRGLELKNKIAKYLESLDIEYNDLGYYELVQEDDYNDIAAQLSDYVKLEVGNLGILFCGTGIGVNIVANKHKGIRSALCFNNETAKMCREHESCNVMCLPADFLDFDTAKKMVVTFIKTPFSMEQRHLRRLNKILKLDHLGIA